MRKNNKRAIKFYKKNGFVKVGKTKFGELPGIVMKKQTGGWHKAACNKGQTGGWGEDYSKFGLLSGGGLWTDMSDI